MHEEREGKREQRASERERKTEREREIHGKNLNMPVQNIDLKYLRQILEMTFGPLGTVFIARYHSGFREIDLRGFISTVE